MGYQVNIALNDFEKVEDFIDNYNDTKYNFKSIYIIYFFPTDKYK